MRLRASRAGVVRVVGTRRYTLPIVGEPKDVESLEERKAAILKAVVEEYIQTAQPVGSGHIASAPGVGVSPATVRNELVQLENQGYLHQPHTSAGRVPTDKGYRFFVDSLELPTLGALHASRSSRSSTPPTASWSGCCRRPPSCCRI
jgi:hypothetical protein